MISYEKTVGHHFDLAIRAEDQARDFYIGLMELFQPYPEIAAFWRKIAAEEVEHARQLEQIRDNLTPEQLSALANPEMLDNSRRVSHFPVQETLANITNLEEAYQIASELENAEINAVFEFMMVRFMEDEETRAFVLSQLQDHISQFIDVTDKFGGPQERRLISVAK